MYERPVLKKIISVLTPSIEILIFFVNQPGKPGLFSVVISGYEHGKSGDFDFAGKCR
jgi:hypothetical protein